MIASSRPLHPSVGARTSPGLFAHARSESNTLPMLPAVVRERDLVEELNEVVGNIEKCEVGLKES